jgi:hypothetical protein
MSKAGSGAIFNYSMDKNTPKRKDNLADKLVIPMEDRAA